MATRCRYVEGPLTLQSAPADKDYPIEKGDLLYLDTATGKARPASALNAEGTQAKDQLGFASRFLGVAMEKNGLQPGETTFRQDGAFSATVQYSSTGRFEFDCPAQAFTVNQPVGVYSASGAGCSDQEVDALAGGASLSQMIWLVFLGEGRLKAQAASLTMTRVVVDIHGQRPFGTAPAEGTYTGTSGQ